MDEIRNIDTVNEEQEENSKAKKKAAKENPWEIMKQIRLPNPKTEEAQSFYAAVNGRAYNIPYNQDVEVPLPIYECLRNSQALIAEAESKANAMKLKPGDNKYL